MNILYTILSSSVTALIFLMGWSVTIGRKLQIIDDLKEDLDNLRKEMRQELDQIREDIKILIDRVSKIEGRMEQSVNKNSPLSPTPLGAKYIAESGLGAILDDPDKKAWLLEKLKADLPEDYLDYDVEESSRSILFALRNDRMMRPIKEYAFRNGLGVEVILGAGALWLRDDFMGVQRKTVPMASPKKEEEVK